MGRRPADLAQTDAMSAAILTCIRDHTRAHGYPPTVRESCEAVGISSTSVVAYHLRRLRAAGTLDPRAGHRITRALRVAGATTVHPGDLVTGTDDDGRTVTIRFVGAGRAT